jgi:hypothetical protein
VSAAIGLSGSETVLSGSDPLGVMTRALRQEQLAALKKEAGWDSGGYTERMAGYASSGLAAMQRIVASSSIEEGRLEACLALADADPNLAFLANVPGAALLAAARGKALEQAIFGSGSEAVEELALLMSVFTNLLDGLVDEAPDYLAPDLAALFEIMDRREWARTGQRPVLEVKQRHPVVALLLDVAVEIICRVVTAVPWQADPDLRVRFSAAAGEAFSAESASSDCALVGPPADPAGYRAALRAKSVAWAWVTALVPLCTRGWPASLDPSTYRHFVATLGVYGGWVDDIADLDRDLRARRWSNVLLGVAEWLGPRASKTDLRSSLLYALGDGGLTRSLVRTGTSLYQGVRASAAAAGLDLAPLQPVLCDLTQEWLETA